MSEKSGSVSAFRDELGEIYFYKGISKHWVMENYHYHSTCEMILVLTNGVTIEVNGSRFKTSYGDLLLFCSNEPHRVIAAENVDHNRYVLMFHPDVISKMSQALGHDCMKYFAPGATEGISRRINLSGQALVNLIAMLDRLDPYYSVRQDPAAHTMFYLITYEILICVQNLFDFLHVEQRTEVMEKLVVTFDMRDTNGMRISQIKDYISEHVDEKLDLATIADRFFISKYYLSHYFKKETGFSIMQYIAMQKMIRAKQMLRQGCSIQSIAMTLNYNSDSHFISTFQKHVGKTPRKYVHELHQSKNQ